MIPRSLLWITALSCLAALGSCRYCSTSIEPAIEVQVRDVESGLPAAERATGYVQDGSYVDSLQTYGSNGQGVPLSFRAADERPGIYTVVVIKEGYQTWKREGVRVDRDECHVQTRSLTAALVPTTE